MKLVRCFALPLLLLPFTASAESVNELIAKGDAHAQKYEEEEALKYYLAAEKSDPKNARLLVAISKEYRHLLSDATSKEDKIHYGRIALEYATRAAALAPRDSEAQLAPAISYGKLLPLTKGNEEKLATSQQIKAAADKAIALDAENDTAWFVLGRWHRGVADIGGLKRVLGGIAHGKLPKSTYSNAALCFRRAIQLNPNRPMHFIELGCVYKEMGKKDEAKKYIEHGLAMAETEKDDPETKQRGREVLRKL